MICKSFGRLPRDCHRQTPAQSGRQCPIVFGLHAVKDPPDFNFFRGNGSYLLSRIMSVAAPASFSRLCSSPRHHQDKPPLDLQQKFKVEAYYKDQARGHSWKMSSVRSCLTSSRLVHLQTREMGT
eukprot:3838044-Amphidinium_carterae.1